MKTGEIQVFCSPMLRLILRRFIAFIPTILVLSWLAFALNRCTPGDPVARLVPQEEIHLRDNDSDAYERIYQQVAKQMGRDLPLFYFSLSHGAQPPEDLQAPLPQQKEWLEHWCRLSGQPDLVGQYYRALRQLSQSEYNSIALAAKELLLTTDETRTSINWSNLNQAFTDISVGDSPIDSTDRARYQAQLFEIETLKTQLENSPNRSQILMPTFSWHGFNNQYHRWLCGLFRGDLGISYLNRQPVGQKIGQALKWTALVNILALLLAYGVAIPLGLRLGARAGSRFDSRVNFVLLLLFSLPAFWIATLVSSFFTTPYYGMDWFPSMGVGRIPDGSNWLSILWIRVQHLFLPVLMLAYPSWAYLSRQMRASTIAELSKPYIRTAKLKGLSENKILRTQVLRNAIFPIITLLAGLLPTLLAGSVLIELIFNLPGMGRLLVNSTIDKDWPVVTAILIISGIATILGLLMADVLYRWADPRLREKTSLKAGP